MIVQDLSMVMTFFIKSIKALTSSFTDIPLWAEATKRAQRLHRLDHRQAIARLKVESLRRCIACMYHKPKTQGPQQHKKFSLKAFTPIFCKRFHFQNWFFLMDYTFPNRIKNTCTGDLKHGRCVKVKESQDVPWLFFNCLHLWSMIAILLLWNVLGQLSMVQLDLFMGLEAI